jgi:hypothetical protein
MTARTCCAGRLVLVLVLVLVLAVAVVTEVAEAARGGVGELCHCP